MSVARALRTHPACTQMGLQWQASGVEKARLDYRETV